MECVYVWTTNRIVRSFRTIDTKLSQPNYIFTLYSVDSIFKIPMIYGLKIIGNGTETIKTFDCSKFPNLQFLHLENLNISKIINMLVLKRLETLQLQYNKLTTLVEIKTLQNIKILDISNNYLRVLPYINHLNLIQFNAINNPLSFKTALCRYQLLYKKSYYQLLELQMTNLPELSEILCFLQIYEVQYFKVILQDIKQKYQEIKSFKF
uniref:Leucine rich repeat protein n=1 Tax=Spironucleus salmonicida TaxID=348837 RepID=V6LKV7_9EUKA|eukprot:EST45265.1 Hypothetical protein SS50377_14841 [Spironucleus salmonicida]